CRKSTAFRSRGWPTSPRGAEPLRVELTALHIPRALRAFDAGGVEVFDVALQGGRVAAIRPSAQPARGLLLSAPVEAHAHIDKNYTVEETGGAQGDLFS